MSTVIILTPVIISSWPAITAAVAGAAAALGCVAKQSITETLQQNQTTAVEQSVEVELSESEVLADNLATEQQIVVTKDNVELRIGKDERGRCKVCANGKGLSKAELKQIAEQFAEKMTQCFVYNRVATELKNKSFQIVNEEVMEDESVRIHVRRWVD